MTIEIRDKIVTHPDLGQITKKVFVISDNGKDLFVENYNEKHDLWGLDLEDIDDFESALIYLKYGVTITRSTEKTRQTKVKKIARYMRKELNQKNFQTFLNDARNHLSDYERGSDILNAWVNSTNTNAYGDFTASGFASKTYYNADRLNKLNNILT